MKSLNVFTATTLTALALAASARAQPKSDDPLLGFYVNANAGANIMQNITASPGGITGTLSTRPGVRATASVGYTVPLACKTSIGLEFETGAIVNSLDKRTITSGGFTTTDDLNGYYYQLPFLVNGVLVCHAVPRFTFYAGIGGGGVYSRLHVHAVDNVAGGDRNSSETDGAVQAMGGVRYLLLPNQEIGIGYKYSRGVFEWEYGQQPRGRGNVHVSFLRMKEDG